MRRGVILSLVVIGSIGLDARAARAETSAAALAVAYGHGVHAFNEGDYQRSFDELSRVIEAGDLDPRAYYFRGLALLRLGRGDEAEADFHTGADLETTGRVGPSSRAISRALERVQGPDRLKLERQRGLARVAALARDRETTRRRYSEIEEAQPDVLRRRRPERVAPAEPVPAPEPREAAGVDAPEPDDADAPIPRKGRPAAEEPEEPAEAPADAVNPFADEPAASDRL
ncbi:MAG: hypothetical protein EBZ74_01020 [Planctomycetia bacterium]|nr:hypothetical protein [Planctomycetia bacterium]